jgi:hypothetical protein
METATCTFLLTSSVTEQLSRDVGMSAQKHFESHTVQLEICKGLFSCADLSLVQDAENSGSPTIVLYSPVIAPSPA